MDAQAVRFGLLLVTRCAVHRLCRKVVVRMFAREIRMTIRASVRLVNRREEFLLVDKKQLHVARRGVRGHECLVVVTLHAIGVLD